MIGSLRGVLVDRSPPGAGMSNGAGEVMVEVGGVGYRVIVAARTLANLGELGSPVFLYTHLHVRDDALTLYGFASSDERACFEALLGAHGVGPSLALAILSAHVPASLRRALAADDADALMLVPGVGKKTAARLLIELKSRLGVPVLDDLPGFTIAASASAVDELRLALAGLGYGADEVGLVLRALPPEGDVDDLLRQALKLLAVAR